MLQKHSHLFLQQPHIFFGSIIDEDAYLFHWNSLHVPQPIHNLTPITRLFFYDENFLDDD
jgi:hypothetical protein